MRASTDESAESADEVFLANLTEGLPPKYTLVASKGGLGATVLDVVKPSRWYEVLLQVHSQKNHAGRDKIFAAVKEQYWNVPKFAIDRFSKLCQVRTAHPGKSRPCSQIPAWSHGDLTAFDACVHSRHGSRRI